MHVTADRTITENKFGLKFEHGLNAKIYINFGLNPGWMRSLTEGDKK